jgi:hypothetical protein
VSAKPLLLVLLISVAAIVASSPAGAQVAPGAEGGPAPEDETQMSMPAPVSGMLYPTIGISEERTNYMASDLTFGGAYIDNVLPGATSQPVSDTTYSIAPKLVFDRSTPHQLVDVAYNPEFIFYEPTSSLDTVDQSASLIYQKHLSPYKAISVQDSFFKTSNVFDVSYPFSEGGLGGSAQAPTSPVIAPFADQLRNDASASFDAQIGRNAMIGGGGMYSNFQFSDLADAIGLENSHGGGASGFYDRRISRMQYAGISYDYNRILAGPNGSQVDTQLQSVLPFYTFYLRRTISFSLSAGAQHVNVAETSQAVSTSWLPAGVVSMGWQGNRGTISTSYLHTTATGGGLVGAYKSNSANGNGTWKMSPKWSAEFAISYSTISPVAPLAGLTYQGGNAFAALGSIAYRIGERFSVEGGYERLRENFSGIAVVSRNPDSDRTYVTLAYHIAKSLGR